MAENIGTGILFSYRNNAGMQGGKKGNFDRAIKYWTESGKYGYEEKSAALFSVSTAVAAGGKRQGAERNEEVP